MLKWFKKQPIGIRAAIIGGIFVIAAALITIVPDLIGQSENNNNIQDDTNKNQSWKLIEISLRNWQQKFDRNFLRGLDSVRSTVGARVGFESGPTYKAQIEYCIFKRLERDNIIDSFVVEYALHGGDTTIIKLNRKLPINVRSLTMGRGRDYGPHYKGVILDTL